MPSERTVSIGGCDGDGSQADVLDLGAVGRPPSILIWDLLDLGSQILEAKAKHRSMSLPKSWPPFEIGPFQGFVE